MEDASTSRPKHVLVVCNPRIESFSMAVAGRYAEVANGLGQEVVLRDLYRLQFDPVLKAEEEPSTHFEPAPDVRAELEAIKGVGALVLIYPLWFGMPPAMLKGYVDRVLGAGFSFRSVEQQRPHPLLGARLVSFSSSGTRKPWLEEQGAWMSLRTLFDDYLRRAFSMHSTQHTHFGSMVDDLKQRFIDENLYQVEQVARGLCSDLMSDRAAPAIGDSA